MDRREFFGELWKRSVTKGIEALEKTGALQKLETLTDPIKKERPPGAVPEKEFQQLCTGCDACMVTCPVNVIMIDDIEKRHPVIYPEKDPCIMCEDTPCVSSCPTGALKLVK